MFTCYAIVKGVRHDLGVYTTYACAKARAMQVQSWCPGVTVQLRRA